MKILSYNNFLTEGLINTYPISIHYKTLLDNISFINSKIDINYENETFKLILPKIDFNNLSTVNSFCNNLGYYITKFKVIKNNNQNIITYNDSTFFNDIKDNDGLVLFYETKFGTEIKPPEILYHATNIKNIERINKNGLYPKSTSKLEYHFERIYFSKTLIDCENLIPKLRNFDVTNTTNIKDFIIYEINIKDFNNVKFYIDPKSNGIYTYYNIQKEWLNILKTIYTENDKLYFDSYQINKISNPIYMEFYKNNEIIYKIERKDLIRQKV